MQSKPPPIRPISMKRRTPMSQLTITMILFTFLSFNFPAQAKKAKVQQAMKDYVNLHMSQSKLFPVIYQGKVLRLELARSKKYPDGFHQGIKNKGSYYTSCADFVDPKTGKKYDIDFLVNKIKGKFAVVQPIVHSIDGKKNPYDLSH